MQICGQLTASTSHRQLVKTPVITIETQLRIELERNDVPVTLCYKHGNAPWRSLLINDVFNPAGVPRYSDVYLMCSASADERVDYQIFY